MSIIDMFNSFLEPMAAKAVSGLMLTRAKNAVAVLKRRFRNREVIVYGHILF